MSDMEKSINQFYEQARSLAHSIPICDLGSREGLIAIEIGLREAYRMGREAGRGEAAESHEEAEGFIKEAIDSAPEPLRRLGEYLARVLDDDHWKAAERMLLGAAQKWVSCSFCPRRVGSPSEEDAARGWNAWMASWKDRPHD